MTKKIYLAVMSFFSAVAVMFSSMQSFALSPRLPFTRAIQADSPSVGEEIEFKRTVNTDSTYFSGEKDKYTFVLVKSKSALDDFVKSTIVCPERYAVQYSEDYFKTGALIFFYGINSYIGEYTRIESIVKPAPDTLSINAVYYYDDYDGGRTCVGDNLMSVYEISASDAEGVDNLKYNVIRKPYEKSDTRAHEKKSGENLPENTKWLYEDTCLVYDNVTAGSVCSYFDGAPELYRNGEKLSFDGNLILKIGDIIQYKNKAGEVCYAFDVSRYCDVNGDGKITLSDARLALRAAARLESLSDAQCVAATGRGIDYDDEDAVYGKYPKLSDARKVLRVVARLESAR